ncbi:class I SAM-dependent methyltransferase [Streptomyces sp. NPDC090052]|uniref:SAM-dependent methyltransferase n=1 Tax=unclassified Streptomyces TaxID=2593676 RepID=UPI00224F003F|nr:MULTISPECIES: cyclopropane-fatty-acyl-phospholipid synthase family protein [unclassified Streptomyces]MCX4726146.1 cyclopropane-fatty-acyl-phospholipid synthase family protein [Streptomyces sp. NBC_01306]WSV04507.1 cyclopropane-fatty-acyl-phospholipid synthase family protein [Streptomyces sp. NBC_01020]WSX42574.1 cyclopropane-fatty-acyl-phospholipid synthase family protein [Streptomyces sp. NBC_00963]WSX69381.1 cyclopropane-fatty-acyl-phospholipid synthase family protein [Streptomyces sp. NB
MADAALRLTTLAEELLGAPLPVRIRAWDGSESGPPGTPVLVIRHRRALRRLLWKPGELGLARAWVAGEIDVDGDLYAALDLLAGLIWERDDPAELKKARLPLFDPKLRAAARGLLDIGGLLPPPPPPAEEIRRRRGPVHTKRRDQQAISHHYDVGNDFYELVLGPSMVYSCAYWAEDSTLETAQRDKLDLVCRKLELQEGMRLLDVGCGWGSMAIHAAREYGARVTGVTLSREQAAYARKRIAEEGLTDRIEIRVQDYRDVKDGPYDAISSIGMAEHVGSVRYREYADDLFALLKPGGRLLNHQIGRRPERDESAYEIDAFIDAYVFPDGELSPVGRTVELLEEAGFEARDVEMLREHYALTLREWVANLEARWAEAVRLTSPGRARIWRLYMAASALAFEKNRIGVNQVLAVKTPESGASGMPRRARDWR